MDGSFLECSESGRCEGDCDADDEVEEDGGWCESVLMDSIR